MAVFCRRCKRILDRVDMRRKPDRNARVRALKSAWDSTGRVFRCYYTGLELNETDSKKPLYLTFDHRIPRNETDVVVTAACINDMKSDLTEEEFKAVVLQLAHHFTGGSVVDPAVFNLSHWKR